MAALFDMFKKNFKPQTIASSLQNTQLKLRQVVANKSEEKNKIKKEIVDCITSGNTERAKIKVIPVIREDNRVYAMEVLETYCGLLYQQAGLLESSRHVDKSLAEAVSTLIWASPRFEMEIPELKEVATLLGNKYGKDYVEKCRKDGNGTVSQVIKKKLEVDLPPPFMVEKYLSEIALECNKVYIPKEPIPEEAAANANAALYNIYGEVQLRDQATRAERMAKDSPYEIPISEERGMALYKNVSGVNLPRNRLAPQYDTYFSNMPLPQPPLPAAPRIPPSNHAPLARQQLPRQNPQTGNPPGMVKPPSKSNIAASQSIMNETANCYEEVQ